MSYFELVEGGKTIAAFNNIVKAKEGLVTVANKRFRTKFGSYNEALSFLFEAGMMDDLFIRTPEQPDEDEILSRFI